MRMPATASRSVLYKLPRPVLSLHLPVYFSLGRSARNVLLLSTLCGHAGSLPEPTARVSMAATSVAIACGARSVRERRTWKLGHTGCSGTIACRYAVYDYSDGRKYVGWWLDAQPHFVGLMSMADGLQYRWVRDIDRRCFTVGGLAP